jgi:hypothetical protein
MGVKTAAMIALLGLGACASQTRINSTPPGAEVLVDGRLIGVTPAVFTEGSTWNWSEHLLTLRRPGFATLSAPIAASDVSVARLLAAAILVWPLLFAVTSYPDSYDFPLTPLPAPPAP